MTLVAIEATHLGKTFKSNGALIHAVRDISLRVEAGELFGLFGHNGAGKSTLVRMLATLVRPTTGRAMVNGHDLVRDERLVRASIGLVASDERSFYGRLSGHDNLRFFAALQNIARQRIDERAQYALDLFGLGAIASRPCQTYSTGQRQRLNLARAILHDPPILFLDEPTKSMDVQTSDFVKALVKQELVGRQHKTIVFISHELYEMENFCDRVAVVHHGELRALGTPAELLRQLPTPPTYRLQLDGDAAAIVSVLRQSPSLASVEIVERANGLAQIELQAKPSELAANGASDWQAQLWQAVVAHGGRVHAFHQVGGRSLRDVIRHFSSDDEQPLTTND